MSNKGYQIHTSVTRYPSPENYYVLCDVCGKKYRKKDTVQIQDKFNLQNRLVVCHNDVDKGNPQQRPFKAREYKAPKLTRPEPYLQNYPQISNPNSNQVPGKVSNLKAFPDPLSNAIDLWWLGPIDGGSDPITGYVIYQAIPQLSVPQVICANTLTGVPFYQDLTTPVDTYCEYQVAAINAYGIGPLSDIYFYPILGTGLDVTYICMSNGTNPVIQTGSGLNLVIQDD